MSPRALAAGLLARIVLAAGQPRAHQEPLRTRAELSNFEETSTYADVERVVGALAASPLVPSRELRSERRGSRCSHCS